MVVAVARRNPRLPWTGVAAAALIVPGCMFDIWQLDECVRDPELCSTDDQGWQTVSNCPPSDPLQIELGQGELSFTPLVAGQALQVYTASGGQLVSNHVFAALRVVNPQPNHRKFRVQFTLYSPGFCGASQCQDMDYQRLALIGANMIVAGDGSMSKSGFRLMSNGQPKRLEVSVQDECGREAQAVHTVKPAQP